jgi:exopolysaccharide biosynthesis protein
MSSFIAVVLAFYATLSGAAEWISIEPGLSYASWSYANPPLNLHGVQVDLDQPNFRVELSLEKDRGSTPRRLASPQKMNALALINGGFFNSQFSSLGVTLSQGKEWQSIFSRKEATGLLACTAGSSCTIYHIYSNVIRPSWYTVVSGIHSLVKDGTPRSPADDSRCSSFCTGANPRSAVGLSEDNRTLYFMVVEGRRPDSVGVSLARLGQEMKLLGAHNALNLDGGGSSGLVVEGRLLNQRPVNEPNERPVSSALGIVELPQ